MKYFPKAYLDFQHDYPDISKAYGELAVTCNDWGPLDERTRRLVKLGIAIGQNSEGAVKSHTRRALDMGVTAEEVRHSVLMALTTTGFPTMIAAMKWVEEIIEKREKQ